MLLLMHLLACSGEVDSETWVYLGDLEVDQTWNKCCDDTLSFNPEVLWDARFDEAEESGGVLFTYTGVMPGMLGDTDYSGEVELVVDDGVFVTRSTVLVDQLPSSDWTPVDRTDVFEYDPPLQVAPTDLEVGVSWTADARTTWTSISESGDEVVREWSMEQELEVVEETATDFGEGLAFLPDGFDGTDLGLHFFLGPETVWVPGVGPVETWRARRME